MRHFSLLFVALFISIISFAQDDFEGIITYDITYDNLNEQMKAYESMLPKLNTLEIKDGFAKSVSPNAMGGETVMLINLKTSEMITMMNTMGNKIAVRSNSSDTKEDDDDVSIEYSDETKEILGYLCKKVIITKGDIESTVYYTKELPSVNVSMGSKKIDGFPMQTIVETEMFTQIQTASKVDKTKVKKIKMVIPDDFKEMSMEEIKTMGMSM